MFRHGFPLSRLLALAMLLASIALDLRAVRFASAFPGLDSPAKAAFVPIGPRRYPPGYRQAKFTWPEMQNPGPASPRTVIEN